MQIFSRNITYTQRNVSWHGFHPIFKGFVHFKIYLPKKIHESLLLLRSNRNANVSTRKFHHVKILVLVVQIMYLKSAWLHCNIEMLHCLG